MFNCQALAQLSTPRIFSKKLRDEPELTQDDTQDDTHDDSLDDTQDDTPDYTHNGTHNDTDWSSRS